MPNLKAKSKTAQLKKPEKKEEKKATKPEKKEKERTPDKPLPAIERGMLEGYKIDLRTHERRAALMDDSKKHGTLKILRQLNLIRNYSQWNPRAHEIMTKDLEFLEKEYQKHKS